MFIDSEKRLKQLSDEAKKNTEDLEEAKKNSRFTQVSPKGWERVRELLKDSQGISALKLYSFLAEHIDPTCDAVVADQQFLAEKLGVSRSTIIRWLNYLESKNALVRIPGAGKVCFFKQKTAYEICACLVGSEMCIRDSCGTSATSA
ncbi:hypothetical protein JMUB7532_27240 [Staphylococcus aureus]